MKDTQVCQLMKILFSNSGVPWAPKSGEKQLRWLKYMQNSIGVFFFASC